MSKRITGKTHIGERREKRPNGDIYVYERITAYNDKTRMEFRNIFHPVLPVWGNLRYWRLTQRQFRPIPKTNRKRGEGSTRTGTG